MHGLAGGGRRGRGRSAGHRPGRGHPRQPGGGLLVGGPRRRGAARAATARGAGTLPAGARRRRRPGPRRAVLRSRHRGGGRGGAPRRGAAARAAGAAGARCGPLFRFRAHRGRTARRRGGRGRRRMPGGCRRPAGHRRRRRQGRPGAAVGPGCAVPVGAVHQDAGRRAEPVRSGPRGTGGSVVALGNPHHRSVRRAAAHRCRVPVRFRRGGRTPDGMRRSRPRTQRPRHPTGPGCGAALRSADRPDRRRRVRRAHTGRRPAPQPAGRRGRMHPAGHLRRHHRRRRDDPGMALCRTADRGRHRRPGPLATRRLAHTPAWAGPSHRSDHPAAPAAGGGGLRRSAAVAAVGRPRRRRPDARAPGTGAGAGTARAGGRPAAGAQRRARSRRADHPDPAG